MIDVHVDGVLNCKFFTIHQTFFFETTNTFRVFRPDIATLRALPSTPWSAAALEDLEAPRRQQSVDGEAIKIVIHDVDSGPVTASKRRVILRRDPADKAHRS